MELANFLTSLGNDSSLKNCYQWRREATTASAKEYAQNNILMYVTVGVGDTVYVAPGFCCHETAVPTSGKARYSVSARVQVLAKHHMPVLSDINKHIIKKAG